MLKQTPNRCELEDPRRWECLSQKVCGLRNVWTVDGNDLTALVLLSGGSWRAPLGGGFAKTLGQWRWPVQTVSQSLVLSKLETPNSLSMASAD